MSKHLGANVEMYYSSYLKHNFNLLIPLRMIGALHDLRLELKQ